MIFMLVYMFFMCLVVLINPFIGSPCGLEVKTQTDTIPVEGMTCHFPFFFPIFSFDLSTDRYQMEAEMPQKKRIVVCIWFNYRMEAYTINIRPNKTVKPLALY